MLKRLGLVLAGTSGFVLAVGIIMVIPPGDGNWLFWLCLLSKIPLGLLVLLKSFDFYRRAAFPPDSPALQDPVALWWAEKEQKLYEQSRLAWLAAQFLFFFVPAFMLLFLVGVAARPFYVTLRGTSELGLRAELGRTGKFLVSSAVGLFFLTLSTLMGSTAALGTIAFVLYRASLSNT
ncbi:MAG: hypothetical protein KF760_32875 [Candidatus Eremiobacteraeota bacterium]|nr:hypothetical protein [Candidatus Eremiobacteraeota bacterium]MCW5868531.1 hypothetical protein [Candidatus Eremiobacteraeota bacterium]